MNDQRINDLVRMAMEVEELESSVDAQTAPTLRLVGARGPRRTSHRAWWISAGAAVAAGLAVAFVLPTLKHQDKPSTPAYAHIEPAALPSITAVPATDDSGMDIGPTPPGIIRTVTLSVCAPNGETAFPEFTSPWSRPDAESVEGTAVVAIYRNQGGSTACVHVQQHEWSENKCLSEVSGQEIRSITIKRPCESSAQTLMVALAGPRRELPKNDAQAMRLATCILGSPHDCEGDNRCLSHVAMQCVPKDVSVKIETVADSR